MLGVGGVQHRDGVTNCNVYYTPFDAWRLDRSVPPAGWRKQGLISFEAFCHLMTTVCLMRVLRRKIQISVATGSCRLVADLRGTPKQSLKFEPTGAVRPYRAVSGGMMG